MLSAMRRRAAVRSVGEVAAKVARVGRGSEVDCGEDGVPVGGEGWEE